MIPLPTAVASASSSSSAPSIVSPGAHQYVPNNLLQQRRQFLEPRRVERVVDKVVTGTEQGKSTALPRPLPAAAAAHPPPDTLKTDQRQHPQVKQPTGQMLESPAQQRDDLVQDLIAQLQQTHLQLVEARKCIPQATGEDPPPSWVTHLGKVLGDNITAATKGGPGGGGGGPPGGGAGPSGSGGGKSWKTGAKLPTLQLETFGGDIPKFPAFWHNFYSLVDSREDLDRYQKSNFLQQVIKPGTKAADAIQGFADKVDQYDDIINHLKFTFGNKRLLLSTLIRAILFKPQAASNQQARPLLDFLVGAIRSLEAQQVHLEDPCLNMLLLSIFESKLPVRLAYEWEEYIKDYERTQPKIVPERHEAAPPTTYFFSVQQFLDFCNSRVHAQAAADHIREDGKLPSKPSKGEGDEKQKQNSGKEKNSSGNNAGGGGGEGKKKTFDGKKKKGGQNNSTPLQGHLQMDGETTALVTTGGGAGGGNSKFKKPSKGKDRKPKAQAGDKDACLWCTETHDFRSCNKYKEIPIQQRWERIRAKGNSENLCYCCFSKEHKSPQCTQKCTVDGCGRPHHVILHDPSKGKGPAATNSA